jgi:hypothetical protein
MLLKDQTARLVRGEDLKSRFGPIEDLPPEEFSWLTASSIAVLRSGGS